MIIEWVRVRHWRTFYGTHDLSISQDPGKNVTLIRAQNGVGKTSLLQAINWTLFGDLPGEDEDPNGIVNKFALQAEKSAEATVEVCFSNDGKRYKAKRSTKNSGKAISPLMLVNLGKGGEKPFSVQGSTDDFIRSVIPEEMAPHFFFFGEQQKITTSSASQEKFGNAVRDILGSSAAVLALKDIESALNSFRKEASSLAGGDITKYDQEIEKKKEQTSRYLTSISEIEGETKSTRRAAEVAEQEYRERAAEGKEHKNLFSKYKDIQTKIAQLKRKAEKLTQDKSKWLGQFGISLVADSALQRAQAAMDKVEEEIGVPAPYNKDFVAKILSDGICVCGTKVEKGTKAAELVKQLLETAADTMVLSRIKPAEKQKSKLEGIASSAWSSRKQIDNSLSDIESRLSKARVEEEKLSSLLKTSKSVPLQDVKKVMDETRSIVSDNDQKIGMMKRTIETLASDISKLQRKMDVAISNNRKAESMKLKIKIAALAYGRLKDQLEQAEEEARSTIEATLKEIIRRFYKKPVSVSLSKNYRLTITDTDGEPTGTSVGESQMIGLAFTAALANYAELRKGAPRPYLLPGTKAPLIIDSPFGQLDQNYRKAVAEFLPELAGQVVLLLSDTQASEEVMSAIEDSIGSQYVLQYNDIDASMLGEESVLDIDGIEYPFSKYGSDFTGSKVVPVR